MDGNLGILGIYRIQSVGLSHQLHSFIIGSF
jgi:hypothetical protein